MLLLWKVSLPVEKIQEEHFMQIFQMKSKVKIPESQDVMLNIENAPTAS